MLEAETQKQILDAYKGHPTVCLWRNNVGAARIGKRFVRFGLRGSADLQGLIGPGGRALYVEVKAPDGVQSPEQIAFQRLVTKFGAIYVLAESVDDVRRALQ